MTFIEKRTMVKKSSDFIPIKPSFRDRRFGSEFNRWELQLLKDFSYAKKSMNPSISGVIVFDRKLGQNRFILIPAAHLTQDYVICECPMDMPIPSNLSNITISGKRRVFLDHWEIMVEKIVYNKTGTLPIKPEISFKEFQEYLLMQWGGIEPLLGELLAFQFVSSPPIFELGQTGGLNLTVYDGTNRGESKKLLKYFRDILPTDIALGKTGLLSIPELATEQPLSPFTWSFRSFDADKPLGQHLLTFLEKRKTKKISEVSIGLGSRRSHPDTLYEPPLTMVDQPTLLPDNVEMIRRRFDPPLEVTKYIISMQMLFPTLGKVQTDIDEILAKTSNNIIEIAEKYDIPQTVRRHGLFDPSYYGKPQSILRLGLASARSEVKQSTDKQELMRLFDKLYLKNMELIMEAWDDMFTRKGLELVSLDEFSRQLLKYIAENETNFGLGFNTITEHFAANKVQEFKIRQQLDQLKDIGKICEPTFNVFKSLPFE
jgi:hypothetical protein